MPRGRGKHGVLKAPSRHFCTAGANDYDLCCEPHKDGYDNQYDGQASR